MKVGILQFDVYWENPQANLIVIESYLKNNIGLDLVVLPEMFLTGFTMSPSRIENLLSESLWEDLLTLCRKYKTSLCGSVPIKIENKWVNRYIHVTPDEVLAHYDKKHLFKLTGEDKRFKGGNEYLTYQYKGWKIRPLICFDLRFPMASYSGKNLDLIIYVANWPISRIEHWGSLLIARAIENQCYVIGVNRVGRDNNRLKYIGNSMIVDFKGETIINLKDSQQLFTSFLEIDAMHDYRSKFPFKENAI